MNNRHSTAAPAAAPWRRRWLAACAIGMALGGGTATAVEIRLNNLDARSGEGLDDATPAAPVGGNPGKTRGEQARIVFEHAAALWGEVLESDVPLAIDASFKRLECKPDEGSLGHAMPMRMWQFKPGTLPAGARANTLYHVALANALAGKDMDPGEAEIMMGFNGAIGTAGCMKDTQWYFGLDGDTPAQQANFLNVVLHEMAHGLGFSAFNDLAKGSEAVLDGVTFHDIYSIHVYDNVLRKHWHRMSDAERVSAAVHDGHLVFTGPHVQAHARLRKAAGKLRAGVDPSGYVLLYAPSTLGGSSFTHFDARLSSDTLMQPFELPGMKAHLDLDLAPSLLQDLGWKVRDTHQRLGECDTGVPTWVPGGAIAGANVAATARLVARTSASADEYAAAIRAHAVKLAAEGHLTAAQVSSLGLCLSPTETSKQYASWHRRGRAAPAAPDSDKDVLDEADAADGES